MKKRITINGITKEIELTPEQEALFIKKQTGWERVDKDKKYYRVNIIDLAIGAMEKGCSVDEVLYNNGYYSSTQAHAERQSKIDILRRRMQRFADENYPDEKWDGDYPHYYIRFNKTRIFVDFEKNSKDPFQIYFNSSGGAVHAIKTFQKEIEELFINVKE